MAQARAQTPEKAASISLIGEARDMWSVVARAVAWAWVDARWTAFMGVMRNATKHTICFYINNCLPAERMNGRTARPQTSGICSTILNLANSVHDFKVIPGVNQC
eukprot:scaffold92911_cov20-Tisochrysis_lutea.AAC.2